MSPLKVQPLLMPVLKATADGAEHNVDEMRDLVAKELKLTDDYLKPINPKTGQSPYVNHAAPSRSNKCSLATDAVRGANVNDGSA
jgi:hypothetical protein